MVCGPCGGTRSGHRVLGGGGRRAPGCRQTVRGGPRGPDRRRGRRTASRTRALVCTRAWIWTCHWSGTVDRRRRDGGPGGPRAWALGGEIGRTTPWSGSPSRHSAAQMIVPPGSYDLGGRRHALHCLVEVLVEGVAAVRGDDEVEGTVDRLHGLAASLAQAAACIGQDRAAEGARDPLLVVEQDVEREVDAGRGRDRPDCVVDGIALDDAPRGSRIADAPRVVELKGGRRGRRVLGRPSLARR